MQQIVCGAAIIALLAGCGSGGNVASVTPVMADTKGTYRLAASSETLTSPGGEVSSLVSSGGTLRLSDSTYNRSVRESGEPVSDGFYFLGTSVNTILNSRHGDFTLTSAHPPLTLTGTYQVIPDFTLVLSYRQFALPDQTQVTRTETWIKESDSPHF